MHEGANDILDFLGIIILFLVVFKLDTQSGLEAELDI
jgi:hypothetical protein